MYIQSQRIERRNIYRPIPFLYPIFVLILDYIFYPMQVVLYLPMLPDSFMEFLCILFINIRYIQSVTMRYFSCFCVQCFFMYMDNPSQVLPFPSFFTIRCIEYIYIPTAVAAVPFFMFFIIIKWCLLNDYGLRLLKQSLLVPFELDNIMITAIYDAFNCFFGYVGRLSGFSAPSHVNPLSIAVLFRSRFSYRSDIPAMIGLSLFSDRRY